MCSISENKPVIVKESLLHGKGLFSTADMSAGTVITKIVGEIIDAGECVRRENEGNVYIFWKDDNTYIDVSTSKELKFINHSCVYNCLVEEDEIGNLVLVAVKDIKMEEELTIDYGYEEIYETCCCDGCLDRIKE